MLEVIYYSRGGNTRKVADTIADELWTIAKDITQVDTLPEDAFIFLGTECYGAGLVKEISDFIDRNRLPGRKIALFTTSAFGSSQELAVIQTADKVTISAESVYPASIRLLKIFIQLLLSLSGHSFLYF
jgi:flavodoxin